MGDTAKTYLCVDSTFVHNAILSLLIIHIITCHQIYGDINNPLLVPPISCLTSTSYLSNYVHSANNVSHAANLHST